MILHTAKGSFAANTFAALAAHQAEFQGACPAIYIGWFSVDVDAAESAEDMAEIVRADPTIIEALQVLSVDAQIAGDAAMVGLCERTLRPDIEALEACCVVICGIDADAAVPDWRHGFRMVPRSTTTPSQP
jgi:hypothetical protein